MTALIPRLTMVCVLGLPIALSVGVSLAAGAGGGWKISFDGGCVAGASKGSEPVIRDGVIYIGSLDGAVYAIDAGTGTQRWRFQTGTGLPTTTTVIEVPRDNGASEMLGAALDRQKALEATGQRGISATPVVDDQRVYIGSWDHQFYALDSASGELAWSFDVGLPIIDLAQIHAGKVIFVSGRPSSPTGRSDGLMHALDASTGKQAWVFNTLPDNPLKKRVPSHPPVIRGGVAYATNWDGRTFEKTAGEQAHVYVHAINVATGAAGWSIKRPGAWPSPPSVSDKHVLFMTSPRISRNTVELQAIDIATGADAWHFAATGGQHYWRSISTRNMWTAPPERDGLVYVATDLEIVALDSVTGEVRWRSTDVVDSTGVRGIALGLHLYAVTQNTLHAFDPASGQRRWSLKLGRHAAINPIVDIAINRVIGDKIYVNISAKHMVVVDGRAAKSLGSLSVGAIGRANPVCAGPVEFGNRLFVATALYESMGAPPTRGKLYNLRAPSPK